MTVVHRVEIKIIVVRNLLLLLRYCQINILTTEHKRNVYNKKMHFSKYVQSKQAYFNKKKIMDNRNNTLSLIFFAWSVTVDPITEEVLKKEIKTVRKDSVPLYDRSYVYW